jgi:hypothetical protein
MFPAARYGGDLNDYGYMGRLYGKQCFSEAFREVFRE